MPPVERSFCSKLMSPVATNLIGWSDGTSPLPGIPNLSASLHHLKNLPKAYLITALDSCCKQIPKGIQMFVVWELIYSSICGRPSANKSQIPSTLINCIGIYKFQANTALTDIVGWSSQSSSAAPLLVMATWMPLAIALFFNASTSTKIMKPHSMSIPA